MILNYEFYYKFGLNIDLKNLIKHQFRKLHANFFIQTAIFVDVHVDIKLLYDDSTSIFASEDQ